MTDSMTHMQILGSKFWGLRLRGLNQKSKKTVVWFCHIELMAKKWLDSIEKQKKPSSVCDRRTDGRTYIYRQS